MSETIRERFGASGQSVLQVAKRSGVPYAVTHGMLNGNADSRLSSVERVCAAIGLELRPIPRSKKKA